MLTGSVTADNFGIILICTLAYFMSLIPVLLPPFQLNFRGYNDKQHVLVQKVMDRMVTFKVDPKRFDIWKENVSMSVCLLLAN